MTIVQREIRKQLAIGDDMTINRLGYGAMHLTGPVMWGDPVDIDGAVRVLRRAVDLGTNFIDTADAYGPGNNERLICRALHPYPDDLVIYIKGGLLRSGPKDWIHGEPGAPYIVPLGRPAYLREQVELSLRNLGMGASRSISCIALIQDNVLAPIAAQYGRNSFSTRTGVVVIPVPSNCAHSRHRVPQTSRRECGRRQYSVECC